MEKAVQEEVALLLSRVIDPKSNPGLVFRYLVGLYAGGNPAAKEYAIAVDALGRSPSFDPKKDAIVRVEVHKLRKALKEFYAGVGANHPIKIHLAPGRYEVQVEGLPALQAEPQPLRPDPEPAPGLNSGQHRSAQLRLWGFAVVLAVVATTAISMTRDSGGPGPSKRSAAIPQPTPAIGSEVRILAGAADTRFVDSAGAEWGPDRNFLGGKPVIDQNARVHNTPDQPIFQTRREGDFVYSIPLPAGHYEVRFYFAETQFGQDNPGGGGESSRIFQVLVNGKVALAPLDVILEAGGPNLVVAKVIPGVQPAADGAIHLRFESLRNDKAFVNAIEIVPGHQQLMLPLRIAAGSPRRVADSSGRLWLPDRFVMGGRSLERMKPVISPSPELFRYERFGIFTYTLPAVPGHRFRLRLWMAEQYYGVSAQPKVTDPRVFDVFVDGVRVLQDVAPLAAAGQPSKEYVWTSRPLTPNHQGALRVSFVPSVNYAVLNALELIDEGPLAAGRQPARGVADRYKVARW